MNTSAIHIIREAAGVSASIAAGLSVWVFAPELVGVPLPWDASWPFYSTAFIVSGFLLSFIAGNKWLCAGGAWVGQVMALLILPLDRSVNMWGEGAWWTLGVLATGVGSLIVAAGWIAGRAFARKVLPALND